MHAAALASALGEDAAAKMAQLKWSTDYGPPIMDSFSQLIWPTVFGPEGAGLAALKDDDVFVELGCGRGGALVAARRSNPKCRIVGVEICEEVAQEAREAVAAVSGEEGAEPISVICGSIDDCFEGPAPLLAEATVLYIFLSQFAMLRLRPRLLRSLPEGARIIVRQFNLGRGWPPDAEVQGLDARGIFRVYTVTAARKEDPWLLGDEELVEQYALLHADRPEGSAF